MVLKLYGFPISTCTLRVATILKEKNVPFEFHNVDITKGEQKAPGFIAHQPFGEVPYIDDDGFILYESRAITRYIATKYASQGPPLIPTDLKKLALFDQAVFVEIASFNPSISELVFELKFKALFGGQTDPARVKELHSKLKAKLDIYETILSKQKYVAGDELTLADLAHLPYGTLLADDIKINEFASRPNVNRWWKDISSRASWQAVKGGLA